MIDRKKSVIEYPNVKYACRYCTVQTTRNKKLGRPDPGHCSGRTGKDGSARPHSWYKLREF